MHPMFVQPYTKSTCLDHRKRSIQLWVMKFEIC
uniref:Uncharacterized protein n=1 Tax=Arundo donax TaxID=35708 RepID=A0A0A9BQT5_ARUDO